MVSFDDEDDKVFEFIVLLEDEEDEEGLGREAEALLNFFLLPLELLDGVNAEGCWSLLLRTISS